MKLKTKSLNKSILLLILNIFFPVGKNVIRPTKHYLKKHSDVPWDLVVLTILSPTRALKNKRAGKDRFTHIRKFKDYIIKVHVKIDHNQNVWVINAFKSR